MVLLTTTALTDTAGWLPQGFLLLPTSFLTEPQCAWIHLREWILTNVNQKWWLCSLPVINVGGHVTPGQWPSRRGLLEEILGDTSFLLKKKKTNGGKNSPSSSAGFCWVYIWGSGHLWLRWVGLRISRYAEDGTGKDGKNLGSHWQLWATYCLCVMRPPK